MRHILVDFNTLTSEPTGLAKFHVTDPVTGEPRNLEIGERVQLYEPEAETTLQVEATIAEQWHDVWLALPDPSTWQDIRATEEQ